jgi:UDP-glucose 4-epimerase
MEESARSLDLGDYFQVPLDTRSLDYSSFFEQGIQKKADSYTSENTYQLSENEVKKLLLALPELNEFS